MKSLRSFFVVKIFVGPIFASCHELDTRLPSQDIIWSQIRLLSSKQCISSTIKRNLIPTDHIKRNAGAPPPFSPPVCHPKQLCFLNVIAALPGCGGTRGKDEEVILVNSWTKIAYNHFISVTMADTKSLEVSWSPYNNLLLHHDLDNSENTVANIWKWRECWCLLSPGYRCFANTVTLDFQIYTYDSATSYSWNQTYARPNT